MTAGTSITEVVVVMLHQAPTTTQQQTEAQIRNQLHQSTAELQRTALENARAQIEAVRAQRAQIEAARAQVEAQRLQGSNVPATPAPPGLPSGSHRITISRDGQVVVGDDGGGGAAVVAGQTTIPNFPFRPEVPQGAVVISIAFFIMLAFIAVGLPLARAWARRMDRQATPPAPFPSDVTDRLERIEHAVESVAIEVERISEGQRFTTKLLTDRGESAPAAASLAAVPVARPDEFAGGGR